jgi:hypothetical protein
MLIRILNNVLDMSRNVLLSQYVGAVHLFGICVYLGLIERGLKHFLTCILLNTQEDYEVSCVFFYHRSCFKSPILRYLQ